MRIGIDVGKAIGVPDGLATASRLLVAGLAEVGGEHSFLLYDLHHRGLDEERLTQVLPGLPANFELCSGPPRAGEVDVFHAVAHRVPAAAVGALVFSTYDLTYLTHPQFHTVVNRVDTLVATVEAASRGARFVAISEHTRQQVVRVLALPESWVEVVGIAHDPVFRPVGEPERTAVLERLGVDRPYVLSVGSLEPRKNLGGLVEAFLHLPDEVRSQHALVVTGAEGWRNREILERLERASGSAQLILTGAVELGELVALYSGAELFVSPSFAEGFGLPVVEAMACGAPVVTSSCTSLPEVAGDAALLVDPTDPFIIAAAMGRALADTSLREELRQRGLERAKRFSHLRTAERMLGVYRRVAGG